MACSGYKNFKCIYGFDTNAACHMDAMAELLKAPCLRIEYCGYFYNENGGKPELEDSKEKLDGK